MTNGSLSLTTNASAGTSGSPSKTSAVASSAHTHNTTANGSVALSLENSSSTGTVEVVTSLSGTTGTTKYLTASTGSPSATATVAANGHTHKGTATGNVSLGLNDTASGGTALITALNTGQSVGGSVTLNNTASSGIKYIQEATHSHTPAAVSDSATAVTDISGGSLTPTTKYLKIDK